MRACWVILAAAAVAAASGCRVFDRWSKDRGRTPGDLSGRTRDDDPNRPPKNFLNDPAPAGRTAAVPAAGTWTGPNDKQFDIKAEFQRMIAGVVVDPDGNPVPNLDVQYELADQPGVAGVPVQTDKNGIFMIRGLKANAGYTLTAQVRRGGKPLAAQTVARTPSPHVKVQLRDDITLPAAPPARSGGDLPPTSSVFDPPRPIPAADLDYPRPNTDGGGYSPTPPPAANRPPVVPKADLVAPGPPTLDKPPAASIPGGPTMLLPPPTSSKFGPGLSRPAVETFSLRDSAGRPRDFPAGRAGEFVLFDFLTSTCVPCRAAIPALTKLQSKYAAAGLDVVGVVCDDDSEDRRRATAGTYADAHNLNYLLYTEAGAKPGAVMAMYGVKQFPTLVLVDGLGAKLWQGHPRDLAEVEAILSRK